jgi:hypothetical protein
MDKENGSIYDDCYEQNRHLEWRHPGLGIGIAPVSSI